MRFSAAGGIKISARIFGGQSTKKSLSDLAWDGQMVGSGQERRFCFKRKEA
jgi:hypothetical protein